MMNESKRLEELKKNFESTHQRSLDKDAFMEREIEGYSKIFDDNKLKLPVLSKEDEPLVQYDMPYSSMRIFLIRQFYIHFIIEGNDISELVKDEWNSWLRDIYEFALEELSEPHGPKFYYSLTRDLHEYIKWLKNYPESRWRNNERSNKKPDTLNKTIPIHFYALYQLLKEDYLDDKIKMSQGHKKEIIKSAERLYQVKGVNFYNSYMKYRGMKVINYIKLMPLRKRNKYRETTFKIASSFNYQPYISWWEITFLDKSKNTY